MNKMPGHVISQFSKYPMAYSNWGILMLKLTFPYYEVAVCGDDSKQIIERVQNQFQPQILWAFSENKSEVPIFKDRLFPGKNLIYVCQEGVCKLPVQTAEEALGLLYLD
jgi:uncharacterized protein YyaL (SSP411 family)